MSELGMGPVALVLAVAVCGAGAALWLLYFAAKDRIRPEPPWALVGAVLLGALAAGGALLAFRVGEATGLLPGLPAPGSRAMLFYCLLAVGPIEEGAKFLVARAIVFRWRVFDEWIDGMVYAAAIGIGFATLENLLYWPHLGWTERLARAAASPLTHALFAVVWGLPSGRALVVTRGRAARWLLQALPLTAAMLLHGLYDGFLLAAGAPIAASGVVLALWLAALWRVRFVLRRATANQE